MKNTVNVKETRMNVFVTEGKRCNACKANITAWTWASDKCCRTCIHYDGSYCDIDDRRYGENYYCSSWRP